MNLKQKCRKISAALAANLLVLFTMVLFMRPSFETNDDIVFAELGSGLRGVKDAHLVFQNYGLGVIYRFLYAVTGRLPWYTIFQYVILLVAFTAVTYVLMNRLEGISGLCLSLILVCGSGYEGYIHLQFTKTAGIAAAASVFLLLYVLEKERWSWAEAVLGICLGIMAYMYREDQFWASCGLMAGAGLLFLFDFRKYKGRKLRRLGLCVLTFGVLLACVFGVDRWDASKYQSAEWKGYQEFNQLRSRLLDYGFPDYDSNQETYEELGISRDAYELYRSWNFNDIEKFNTDVMRKLVDLKQQRPLTGKTVTAFLKRFPSDLLKIPMFYVFAGLADLGTERYLFRTFCAGRVADASGGIFLSVLSGTVYGEPCRCRSVVQRMSRDAVDHFSRKTQAYECEDVCGIVHSMCGSRAVSDVQKLEDHDFDYPGGKSEPEGSSGNDRNR